MNIGLATAAELSLPDLKDIFKSEAPSTIEMAQLKDTLRDAARSDQVVATSSNPRFGVHLSQVIFNCKPQCVVLNACESDPHIV